MFVLWTPASRPVVVGSCADRGRFRIPCVRSIDGTVGEAPRQSPRQSRSPRRSPCPYRRRGSAGWPSRAPLHSGLVHRRVEEVPFTRGRFCLSRIQSWMSTASVSEIPMFRSREPQYGQGCRSSKASMRSTAGKTSAHAAQLTDLPPVSLLTSHGKNTHRHARGGSYSAATALASG
jgi:hypothetical protein